MSDVFIRFIEHVIYLLSHKFLSEILTIKEVKQEKVKTKSKNKNDNTLPTKQWMEEQLDILSTNPAGRNLAFL